MAEPIDDAEFWLPSTILMDDDILMENQNLKSKNGGQNSSESLASSHCFPTEFPYEFDYSYDSFSVVESTETESSDEEAEFLAGLTRRIVHSTSQKRLAVPGISLDKIEKTGGLASSSESTLSVLGSFSTSNNGGSRVTELKMSNGVPQNTMFKHGRNQPKIQNHDFLKNSSCGLHLNQSISCDLAQTNHVSLQNHGRQMEVRNQQQQHKKKNIFQVHSLGAFPGNERKSVGTGVFFPRECDNKFSEPRKKSGKNRCLNRSLDLKTGCPMFLLPAKVVLALNFNFDHANSCVASDYVILIPRRNANSRQENINC
ncbi:hypothetical protein GQ457_05G032150 [Hibiscus cannabinus]